MHNPNELNLCKFTYSLKGENKKIVEDKCKSDLFCENTEFLRERNRHGDAVEEVTRGHLGIIRWKPLGGASAVTIQTPPLWQLDVREYDEVRECLAEELRHMLNPSNEKKFNSLLVIGLGNPALTSDALGPETVRRIAVSAPDKRQDGERRKGCTVSAFVPDVFGNTGIETAQLIRGIVTTVRPDLVLAVDALAAKNPRRLGTVIQLSDGGICPGSGLGNHRKEISRRTLGVPVIAMGIPTVVSSYAMMAEMLEVIDVPSDLESIRALLEEGRRFFVTPKEIDLIVQSASFLLSDAIHGACGIV